MISIKSHFLVASSLLAGQSFGFPGESNPNFMPGVLPSDAVQMPNPSELARISATIQAERDRCNSDIIDVHLHDAFWFGNSAAPLLAEMDASSIAKGIMLAVYGPVADPFGGDPNERVESIVKQSQGRILGLASLNTTVSDWDRQGGAELERLATFLAKPNFVGTKLAPPHTCMALDSQILRDVVHTVSVSPSPLSFIHMGTTPFCGPFGTAILGRPGCCGAEYVDPSYAEDLVKDYPNTTFVLVHAGADFLPPTDEYFYNGANVDQSIRMASTYDNVYLEISAFLRQDANQTDVYPGSTSILQQIADAGLASKTFYGSDVNQAPGSLAPYLAGTVEKMIEAGFTEEERCMILGENTQKIFLGASEEESETPAEETSADQDGDVETEDVSLVDTYIDSSAPRISTVATLLSATFLMVSTAMMM